MQESSYWQSSAEFPTLEARQPLPTQIDIAIIGGGYTGLAAARELAMQGARVAVFDAHTFGWGASSRNGGQVLTGTKLAAGALLKKYGKEVAQQLWRNSLECIAYIEALVKEEQIDCEFTRCGHLELAYKPSHFQAYEADADLLSREFNHPVRIVQKKDLHEEVGSDAYHGGLVDEASAGVHPAKYVAGLMRRMSSSDTGKTFPSSRRTWCNRLSSASLVTPGFAWFSPWVFIMPFVVSSIAGLCRRFKILLQLAEESSSLCLNALWSRAHGFGKAFQYVVGDMGLARLEIVEIHGNNQHLSVCFGHRIKKRPDSRFLSLESLNIKSFR